MFAFFQCWKRDHRIGTKSAGGIGTAGCLASAIQVFYIQRFVHIKLILRNLLHSHILSREIDLGEMEM